MTKPTPRPWDHRNGFVFSKAIPYSNSRSNGICNMEYDGTPEEEMNANARHIVHCVNLHEEMLEFIQRLSHADFEGVQNYYARLDSFRTEAKKLIKKAEGES